MKQYIDKSAVIAEIERRIASLESIGSENYLHDNYPEQYAMLVTLKSLKFSLDTLEVKEVDLEKEIETHLKDCLDVKFPTTDIELIKKDVAYTAKKFFELGMSVNKQAIKDE